MRIFRILWLFTAACDVQRQVWLKSRFYPHLEQPSLPTCTQIIFSSSFMIKDCEVKVNIKVHQKQENIALYLRKYGKHLQTSSLPPCRVVSSISTFQLSIPFLLSSLNSAIVTLNPPRQVNTPWGTWCTVCLEAATTTTAAVGEEATPTACWERPCQMTPSQLSAALCMRSSLRTWRTLRPCGTLGALRSSLASPVAKETSKPNGKNIIEWKKNIRMKRWEKIRRWVWAQSQPHSANVKLEFLIWLVSISQVRFESSLTFTGWLFAHCSLYFRIPPRNECLVKKKKRPNQTVDVTSAAADIAQPAAAQPSLPHLVSATLKEPCKMATTLTGVVLLW